MFCDHETLPSCSVHTGFRLICPLTYLPSELLGKRPLQIEMFLKFDDQKLSSRDDQQTPYQSACHETMEK